MDDGITVTGVGRVTVTPDRLHARLRLSCAGADVSEALTALTSRTNAILAVIREQGVPDQDLVTTGLRVEPRWSEREQGIDGYEATHRITVTLGDHSEFGELQVASVSEHRPGSDHGSMAVAALARHGDADLEVMPGTTMIAAAVTVCWTWS